MTGIKLFLNLLVKIKEGEYQLIPSTTSKPVRENMKLRRNPKKTPKSAPNSEIKGLPELVRLETEEDATQVNVSEHDSFQSPDVDALAHISVGIQSPRKRRAGGTTALNDGQKRVNVAFTTTQPPKKPKKPTSQYDIMMSDLGSMNAMLRSSLAEGSNRLYPVGYESQSERYGVDVTFDTIKTSVANGEPAEHYSPELLEQLGFVNPDSNEEEDYVMENEDHPMGRGEDDIQEGEESNRDDFLFSVPKDPSETTPGYSA
jgi:hypothetical protein